MELSLEFVEHLHRDCIPDENLWSLAQLAGRHCSSVGGKSDRCDLLGVLGEMLLSVGRRVVHHTQASDVIGDGAIEEMSDVVSRFVSFIAVNPIDGGSNVWRFSLILGRLGVAGGGFDLASPGLGVEELIGLLVGVLLSTLVLSSACSSLSLLRSSLGRLFPLRLPFLFLGSALIGQILLDFSGEVLLILAELLFVIDCLASGPSEVSAPDEDCLVVATDSHNVLILGRENYPSHVGTMASDLFCCSLLNCAGVAEQLDKSILLRSRKHISRVGPSDGVDIRVGNSRPDSLNRMAKLA